MYDRLVSVELHRVYAGSDSLTAGSDSLTAGSDSLTAGSDSQCTAKS